MSEPRLAPSDADTPLTKVYVVLVLTEWDQPGAVDSVFTDRATAERYVELRTKEAQENPRHGVADSWWLDEGELDPFMVMAPDPDAPRRSR